MPPVYFFAIDVSAAAHACGMVAVVADTIRACLDQLPGDERTQVGFLTYDSSLHFYNLKASLAAPQVRAGGRGGGDAAQSFWCSLFSALINSPGKGMLHK
jgi:hypothetical protein